jgi:alpha-glucosidase
MAEKYTQAGKGLHAVYDFDLINTPPEPGKLIELLRRRRRFLPSGWLYNVFSNHDATRSVSNLTGFAVEAGLAAEAAKMLLFLQFTLRGGGVIFQGEELGLPHPSLDFEDLHDPWGINLWPDFEGHEGARTPFPWRSGDKNAGFRADEATPWLPIPDTHRARVVDAQEDDPASVLAFLRALLRWQRDYPVLRTGDERIHCDEQSRLIAFERFDAETRITVIVNFGLEPRFYAVDESQVPIGPEGAVRARRRVAASRLRRALLGGGRQRAVSVAVSPREAEPSRRFGVGSAVKACRSTRRANEQGRGNA